MKLDGIEITWLGHATFLLKTPEGKRLLVDPWLAGNPRCPAAFHQVPSDAILVTHGHADHLGDIDTALAHCSGPVVAVFELTQWLGAKRGVPAEKRCGMNKGGEVELKDLGVAVAMTDARHSSSWSEEDGTQSYLGEAAGFVVTFSNGKAVYLAGDTGLFGDMALIGELYAPTIAILPIGDRFTMGPAAAARAARLCGVRAVIPCHYGTFSMLTGTAAAFIDELAEEAPEVHAIVLEPGQRAR